ncbi:MAG: hypothetical protein AAGJ93_02600 [Bacteroidota bacterium]
MDKKLLFFSCLLLLGISAWSQNGTYYGLKGGLTIGTQQWNSFDRNPLIAYHGILSMESASGGGAFSLFAQAGYHVKGSSIRRRLFGNPFNASAVSLPPQKFEFQNLSLSVGAKQSIKEIGTSRLYYMFGVRLDYTLDTNLDEYTRFTERNPVFSGIYPIDTYFNDNGFLGVRRLNYGFLAGGGITLPFSEFIEGMVEFSVNPDFSLQYEQPSIDNVLDPFSGQNRTIPERRIRNLTFEISVGVRFLRKVEYID